MTNRKNIHLSICLTGDDAEALDRIRAALQRVAPDGTVRAGVSHAEAVRRSIRHLDAAMHPTTLAIRLSPAPTHPDLISGKE